MKVQARQACRLLGSMEISGNTAEKQALEETGGGDGRGKGRKEEEESGGREFHNEDSDEKDGEPRIEMSQR